MGVLLFSGCCLVAFSAPLSVFLCLISQHIQLVIVMITAAFFWLLSIMIAALLWYLLTPLQTSYWILLPVSVVIQEAARLLFYCMFARAELSFSVVSTNAIAFPMTDIYTALASGCGFAIVHSVLFYGTLISYSIGPGTFFADTCPEYSVFVVTSWMACAYGIIHMLLMVIAFDAFRQSSIFKFLLVFTMHLGADFLTMLNQMDSGCLYAIPSLFGLAVLLSCITLYVVTRSSYRSAKKDY